MVSCCEKHATESHAALLLGRELRLQQRSAVTHWAIFVSRVFTQFRIVPLNPTVTLQDKPVSKGARAPITACFQEEGFESKCVNT